MDLISPEESIEKAVKLQNIVFVCNWEEILKSLYDLRNLPATSPRILLSIQLLNKILHVQATSFQRCAIQKVCSVEFLSQLKDWFSDIERENFMRAIDAANVVQKYMMKAHELNLIISERIFSVYSELKQAMVNLSHRIGCLSPDLVEAADSLCANLCQLDSLISGVIKNDIFSDDTNEMFLKSLETAKPQRFSEYIVWLYMSLKGDFQLGLNDGVEQKCERSPSNFKAKVKVVSFQRQMVSPSKSVLNVIDIGFEISKTDLFQFNECDGAKKIGSLCFLYKDSNSTRIPVLCGKTTIGGNGLLFVCFDVVGDYEISLDTTYFLDWSPVYFEPYARVLVALKYLAYDELPIINSLLHPSVESLEGNKQNTSSNWPLSCSLLNSKQKLCISTLFQKPVTLIQGPPGTGKTHVCIQMIKTLFENRKKWDPEYAHQVLIVSMKNDTLDKLLMELIDDGRKVIRIGGMSKASLLRVDYNVSHVGKSAVPSFKAVADKLAVEKEKISSGISSLQIRMFGFSNGLIPVSVLKNVMCNEHAEFFRRNSLTEWLFELGEKIDNHLCISRLREIRKKKLCPSKYPQNFTMLFKLEEDIRKQADDIQSNDDLTDLFKQVDILHGKVSFHYHVETLLNYNNANSSRGWSNFNGNLESLGREERWYFYHYWKSELQRECEKRISSELACYQENDKTLQEVYQMASAVSIATKNIEVIGATSCAAAKHRVFIENLNPKLIIIEEAAELLESHIVVSLAKSTKSIILIGDHCQLAPRPASQLCHMKVSVFQRLIDEGLQPLVLDEQYRMRPEISKLVSLLSYPSLVDGRNVQKYPPVHGMKYNLFFVDNSHKEEMIASFSFLNNGEAERVVQICTFLVNQGYDPHQITVISPYNGQVRLILSMLRKLEITIEVEAMAVDGYQGEENDIIILSTVRSNCEGRIGFLSDKRRVTVALSRAKLGLYIVGNVATLKLSNDSSWALILKHLEDNCLIGSEVLLRCQQHSYGKILTDADITDGFCPDPCMSKLSCGHICKHKCHGGDRSHKKLYSCTSDCERYCSAGHKCTLLCGERCVCNEMVENKLLCGHNVFLRCNKIGVLDDCDAKCTVSLECGHTAEVMCRSVNQQQPPPDCLEICGKVNADCNHTCQRKCYLPCKPCTTLVEVTLNCGHSATKLCGLDTSSVVCSAVCKKKLPCDHTCFLRCGQDCVCENIVTKTLCEFGHTAEMLCSEPATPCKSLCVKTFDDCGHACKNLCSEDCECSELVYAKLTCGHSSYIPCHVAKNIDEQDEYEIGKWCTNLCGKTLPCSHPCEGTCGSCIQGVLHRKCRAKCTNALLCGHTCTAICSDLVHVCKEADCLGGMATVNQDKLPSKKKVRRTRTLFDVTRQINNWLDKDTPKVKPPSVKTAVSKRSLIPKIKQQLTSIVIGPLYEKIIRIPNSMLEKNALVNGLISNLMIDIRDVWISRVPTVRFLKNLIFKMEFSVLLIRYHQEIENKASFRSALGLNLTLLAQILNTAKSQEYTFSWDQILQLVDLVRRDGPLQFQYTLEYAKPLSDHQSDENAQTWTDWINC